MEYVEYGWNTGGIQASGRSFGIRGKRIQTVGSGHREMGAIFNHTAEIASLLTAQDIRVS